MNALDFRRLPKVLLHEHLDGGLRPKTVIELAKDHDYLDLPTDDPDDLAAWFHRGAQRGSLPQYLEGFAHTIAVMQTRDALVRVACEFLEDMAADGVLYAELRFAPVFHTASGLTQDEVVRAVLDGLEYGERKTGVSWGLIICAMRDRTDSLEAAELAIRWRDHGVVGFDLAGGESGFPAKKHIDAFHAIQRANFYITIHAGEAFGPESIWQALQWCGAHRLGHGTRLRKNIEVLPDGSLKLGTLAQYIMDRRVPLEMCLSSNIHTGACATFEDHPFALFQQAGFRVFLNTDDRLMSDTEMSKELEIATTTFDLSLPQLEKMTMDAMKSAFAPHKTRIDLIQGLLLPSYAKLYEDLAERSLAPPISRTTHHS